MSKMSTPEKYDALAARRTFDDAYAKYTAALDAVYAEYTAAVALVKYANLADAHRTALMNSGVVPQQPPTPRCQSGGDVIKGDANLIFDRIGKLLKMQRARKGVRTLTVAGYTFTAVKGVPYNTVDPPLSELAEAPQEHRNAFVADLIRQWIEAQGGA